MIHIAGLDLDSLTRCQHWHAHWDVVAIRLACCEPYWACIACHHALADHPPQLWPRAAWGEAAVLCGACRNTLSLAEYQAVYQASAGPACPRCQHPWNPGCAKHLDQYLDLS